MVEPLFFGLLSAIAAAVAMEMASSVTEGILYLVLSQAIVVGALLIHHWWMMRCITREFEHLRRMDREADRDSST